MRASTPGGYSDINFGHTTSSVDFVGSPFVTRFLFDVSANIVAIGKNTGVSVITATRKGKSANATVEVVSPLAIATLTVDRYCFYTHIGSCLGLPLNPFDQHFKDSLAVGDTALLTPKLKDFQNRDIKAVIHWTTSNPAIAGLGYKQFDGPVVGAVSPGDAVITALVGGKESAFVLHVYKR
jgi:hypothetical protein